MTVDEKIALLKRRCERIVSEEELRRRLAKAEADGRPLRVKLGMDPTAPDVHLGHCVPLKIVRQFQDWGHKAVLIIGDYTARVGDPTGRNELRPKLDPADIDRNARTYVDQIGKVLRTDPDALEVRFNGEWLGAMTMVDVIALLSRKTLAQILQREDFAQRHAGGVNIHLHELLYPLLQGWDSVQVEADLEMGGSDQLFNNLVGREFQQEMGRAGQMVIVTPLLVGTDGAAKMSKSKKNYIGVTDPPGGPDGIFGKVMRLPDGLLETYFTLLTDFEISGLTSEISERPRDAKVRLAKHLVTWLHDAESADRAEREFMTATHGGVPDDVPSHQVSGMRSIAALLVEVGFVKSKSEAYRKIDEGAIRVDGRKLTSRQTGIAFWRGERPAIGIAPTSELLEPEGPVVLQMGNKRFVRLLP